jgi:hypothetical protein
MTRSNGLASPPLALRSAGYDERQVAREMVDLGGVMRSLGQRRGLPMEPVR